MVPVYSIGTTPILNRLVVAQAWMEWISTYAGLIGIYRCAPDMTDSGIFPAPAICGWGGDVANNN
jgi:hypothetical protein